jgi:3-oxoacyl-[acyl-carrier protein] reductase
VTIDKDRGETGASVTVSEPGPSPLDGRRALVTGGARGIGAAIVRRLAADGATVAFTYRSSAGLAQDLVAEATESGGTAFAIRADNADPDDIEVAVQQAVELMGGLDILVNNAGIGLRSPFEQISQTDFDRLIGTNLIGTCAYIRCAIPHLHEGSRIINIGSINAERVQSPGLAAYAMTKGAVASLTRGLARELSPRGITVNNVQPGPVDTDSNPANGSERATFARSFMAIGRYGEAQEVAAVVRFLAGAESAYVTGANWNVDGGFTV